MSGLPNQFPQQSVPLGRTPDGKEVTIDMPWFLLIYNLWSRTLSAAGGTGSAPASPFDVLDASNLFSQTTEIPQISRRVTNLNALIGDLPFLSDPVPAAQPVQIVTVGASPYTYTALANGTLSVTGGAASAITIVRQGVSVATGITSFSSAAVKSLTDERGSGGTFGFASGVDFTAGTTTSLTLSQSYGNAADLWVAFDGAEQGADSYTLSGTTLTFTAAIPVGTNKVFVKGALPTTTSASGGLVPVRRLDQVIITYTSVPTVAFLPG